ncbi:hypothetical protein H4F76_25545, partial [Enterobacter hormaechei]|nr:hypothetical protein [Enterobacter hormaechei]
MKDNIVESQSMSVREFQQLVLQGIPDELPEPKSFDENINRAPKRRLIL